MNTLMFVLVLGAFNNGDLNNKQEFIIQPIKAFETMEQCTEAGSRVVDKFFVHCMVVEDVRPSDSPSTKQETPS